MTPTVYKAVDYRGSFATVTTNAKKDKIGVEPVVLDESMGTTGSNDKYTAADTKKLVGVTSDATSRAYIRY